MAKRKVFLPKQHINIIYPNKENVIVVPNREKNGDYYENLSLSHSMDEHYKENG